MNRRATTLRAWTSVLALIFAPLVASAQAPSRAVALKIAASFAEYRWTATERNILHGAAPDRIDVQTPDARDVERDGLWKVNATNIGVPYKWGGFDTLESFERGVRAGKAAGDLYTSEKRRRGGAAVSGYAVGIDCSGFISRCWQLAKKQSTHSLASMCRKLPSADELRAGDIMNTAGGHVILFARWLDDTRSRALFYEAEPFSKVRSSERVIAELVAAGYQPLRHPQMRD